MEKISVIVPIYNVRNYLSRCLDSILNQSFSDFEVLCIDDGSTDGSGDICEQYKSRDKRIKVLHIENRGVSNARNFAMTQMEGEWFAFVDADDWIEPNYLEILYNNALKYHCDISACSFSRNSEFCMGDMVGNTKVHLFRSTKECIHNYICSGDSMQGMVWNKLYKSEVFRDVCFNTAIKVNEDCLYTHEVMGKCNSACLTNARLYHWFYREDSACHSKLVSLDFSPANVFLELYEKTLSLQDEEVTKSLQKNYVCSVLKVLLHAKYRHNNEEVETAKKRCKLWKEDIWERLDRKTKVKYYVVFCMPWMVRIIHKKQ